MVDFVYRDVEGTDPTEFLYADTAEPPIPRLEPPYTRIEGPWGVPWIDGLEDPNAPTGLIAPTKAPSLEEPDVGWAMPPGPYTGAYRSRGPVQAWGHEPSGGLQGNQAIGRTMRFPVNIPDRYDANGVWVGDYRDMLAGQLAANRVPQFTDANSVEDLVTWEPSKFAGYEA